MIARRRLPVKQNPQSFLHCRKIAENRRKTQKRCKLGVGWTGKTIWNARHALRGKLLLAFSVQGRSAGPEAGRGVPTPPSLPLDSTHPATQQLRPPPAAETGSSCWGGGQQDASAAQGTKRMLGAATRKQRRPFQIVLLQRKLLQNGKPSAAAARHMEMLPRNGLFAPFTTFQ